MKINNYIHTPCFKKAWNTEQVFLFSNMYIRLSESLEMEGAPIKMLVT